MNNKDCKTCENIKYKSQLDLMNEEVLKYNRAIYEATSYHNSALIIKADMFELYPYYSFFKEKCPIVYKYLLDKQTLNQFETERYICVSENYKDGEKVSNDIDLIWFGDIVWQTYENLKDIKFDYSIFDMNIYKIKTKMLKDVSKICSFEVIEKIDIESFAKEIGDEKFSEYYNKNLDISIGIGKCKIYSTSKSVRDYINTFELIKKYREDKNILKNIIISKMKETGLSESFVLATYNENIDYKKLIEFIEGLKEEGISNDMFIYFIMDFINKNIQ